MSSRLDKEYAPGVSRGEPLAGCFAKLERAKTHLNSLDALIGPFLETEPRPYRMFTKVDVEASRYIGRIGIYRQPPLEWSAIIGDYLQNLRSALDHLVWVLVLANGQKPSGNAFPIFDQPPPKKSSHPEREKWKRHVRGVHPGAVRFIELCQPYNGPDGPSRHALAVLRTLSNEDKHRTLVPAFAAIESSPKAFKVGHIWMRDIRPPLEGFEFEAGKPLENGDLVFQGPVNIIGPNPEIKLNADFALSIGFGRKPTPLGGFVQMGQFVSLILEGSRAFLGE